MVFCMNIKHKIENPADITMLMTSIYSALHNSLADGFYNEEHTIPPHAVIPTTGFAFLAYSMSQLKEKHQTINNLSFEMAKVVHSYGEMMRQTGITTPINTKSCDPKAQAEQGQKEMDGIKDLLDKLNLTPDEDGDSEE